MDQATLDQLRTRLQEERDQHMAMLDEHGADPYADEVKSLNVGNDGFADSGQATEERAELLGQIEASRSRVRAIDQALARMDEGTYGKCITCGQPIAESRLEIRPLSVECVECAAKSA